LAETSKFNVEFGAASHIGRVRTENQDSWGKFPAETLDINDRNGLLFVVADGMGGHQAGRIASELAVKSVSEFYLNDDGQDPGTSLLGAFHEANQQIYEKSRTDEAYTDMGTTCTALVVQKSHFYVAHVGDSRLYRIVGKQMEQLTTDHSRVAALYRRGLLTKEEAQSHPERSQIYRALGVRPQMDVDSLDAELNSKEVYFILSSDGLLVHVSEEEITKSVLANSPQEACEDLVRNANDRGGTDNVTVLVVHLSRTPGSFELPFSGRSGQ